MDFIEVLKSRHSVRAYKPDPIPPSAIENIYQALKFAPSAKNLQPWKFLLILDPAIRAKICAACGQKQLAQSPAIIVALGDASGAWHRLEGDSIISMDIGIAMEHVVLAAANEQLSTCWICAYDMLKVDSALKITTPYRVYALSPLGYAAGVTPEAQHKERGEVFEVIG